MKDDRRFVCHLVNQALGRSQYSYPMYQNAPRPEKETFAGVRLFRTKSPQRDSTTLVKLSDGTELMRTYASRILTFDVFFVGEDELVHVVDSCFEKQEIINKCNAHGYGYLTKEPISLKDTALETDWEPRNGLRLVFHTVRVTDTPLETGPAVPAGHDVDIWNDDYIDELIGEGQVTGDSGNVVESDIHVKR
jgi:hypothetical protein